MTIRWRHAMQDGTDASLLRQLPGASKAGVNWPIGKSLRERNAESRRFSNTAKPAPSVKRLRNDRLL